MENKEAPKSHKGLILSAIVAAAVGIVGVKKGVQYGAAPLKDKECDYVAPKGVSTEVPAIISIKHPELAPTFIRQGGAINDASCLNKTAVYGVANVKSFEDVAVALKFARENDLKVTSAGQRHSMGGQSFSKGGLVLDLRGLDQMKLDKEKMVLRIQSGAKWSAAQELLDKQGLSIKAMQSINIFTVGGTLSVNAHGLAHDPGQVAATVRSMHIMKADGTIVNASPKENASLFKHALGGYGLFGVILDVDLDIVPNEAYDWSTKRMSYKEYPEFYKNNIDGNKNLGLTYSRLSVSPFGYLSDAATHTFTKTTVNAEIPALEPTSLNWVSRLVINISKTGSFGRWLRWKLEKNVEPRFHACVSRNNAMSDDYVCSVSRNQEMYDSMGYLKNRLPDTDILQEYFIPHDKMVQFVDGLREKVQANKANLLNVTIRIVHKDTVTALPYAKDDRFAFVLYFNQKFDDESSETLRKTTVDLIDLAISLGGTYYLPYQLYYTQEQLHKAYPEVDAFFAEKRKVDPKELFVNEWYLKYGHKS